MRQWEAHPVDPSFQPSSNKYMRSPTGCHCNVTWMVLHTYYWSYGCQGMTDESAALLSLRINRHWIYWIHWLGQHSKCTVSGWGIYLIPFILYGLGASHRLISSGWAETSSKHMLWLYSQEFICIVFSLVPLALHIISWLIPTDQCVRIGMNTLVDAVNCHSPKLKSVMLTVKLQESHLTCLCLIPILQKVPPCLYFIYTLNFWGLESLTTCSWYNTPILPGVGTGI